MQGSIGPRRKRGRPLRLPMGDMLCHHPRRSPPKLSRSCNLIQLFLPLYDNEGQVFPRQSLDAVRAELTERFGGVTAYVRSPAVGAWEDEHGAVQRDDMLLFEVMAEELDRGWWTRYRETLEGRFRQDEVLIRTMHVQRL